MTEIRIGSINGSHGVRGWVKVFSYTDPVEAIFNYSPWTLRKGSRELEIEISEGRVNGKRLIARLDGISDRNEADELIGSEILIEQDVLPEPEPGEFYWFQLEGLTVENTAGEVLGQVDHMIETGANDVMVVHASPLSLDEANRLIPYVEDEIVKRVDLDAGRILVAWESDY